MNKQKQLSNALSAIEKQVQRMRQLLNDEEEAPKQQTKVKLPSKSLATSVAAKSLLPAPDWATADWPEAVPSHLIVSEDAPPAEKQFRAIQIANLMSIESAKVLDFGCGEGYTTAELASRDTKLVVGYDIVKHETWQESAKNIKFTTAKEAVIANAPYDVILIYDVLDHVLNEEPATVLAWLRELLSETGIMFLRLHPWTSRHGSHSYEKVNKAYIHLALTPEEMAKHEIPVMPTLRLNRPMASYEGWIRYAGLRTVKKKVTTVDIEPFFTNSDVLKRIIQLTWNGKQSVEDAVRILNNQFVDYTLEAVSETHAIL